MTSPEHGDIRAELEQLSCTEVSDALDHMGISSQCLGIIPLDRSFRLIGQAFTVRYGPVGIDHGTVGDYLDGVGLSQVVVIDNQGRMDCTVWGDLLTLTAVRNGVAGTVIDGICRDIDRSITLSYPIYARGNWMRTGKDRVCVEAVGQPVAVGGARVEAGDWILGDGDGVLVVPQARAAELIKTAKLIRGAEDDIREALAYGATLRAARERVGYHSLQSRPEPRS
jgi:regulator of RNase E activity RraA